MKKLLALVLALVMVMGLAAVGTNATYLEEKYTDVEDINYDEAVAVMSAVGVLEGADQKFRPGTELKRSEAAKIVAYLNTNNKTAEGLIGVGKFSDVPTNHWAAGYIDYLTSINVLAGRGDVFDPDGDLTAVDFAKMLLVVLGFDPQIEGLVGNDYKINTTKLAQDEKLFKGLGDINVNDVLTREQAAQMAFNAVKAPTVEYSNKGGSISINGAEIAIGASGYNYVTTTIANSQNIYKNTLTSANVNANSGYIVEFGERQYPALKLDDEAIDAFGRPCSEWVYNKEEVGKFVNKDLLLETYTTAVTGADLFELLGESRINKSKLTYKVNGYPVVYLDPNLASYTDATGTSYTKSAPYSAYDVYIAYSGEADQAYRSYGMHASNMIRANKIPYAFTGNGVLTEVYEKGEDLIIVSIYTYYAKADSDYSVRSDKLALSFYAFDKGAGLTSDGSSVMDGQFPAPTFKDAWPSNVSAEDVPAAAKYKEKDKMLVRVAYTDAKKFEVQEIYDPEVVKGASISKFSTSTIGQKDSTVQYGGNSVKLVEDGLFYEGYIVTGGETQNYSKAVYPQGLFTYAKDAIDGTFDVVYDLYDYVIATVPNTSSNKYVFIAGVDNFTSNLGVRQADAFAIFANGDSSTIKVNVFDTNDNIDKYMKLRAKADSTPGTSKYEGAVVSPDYTPSYPELDVNEPLHAYNRWFSYSVTGEGASAVYTLYPAGNSLMTGWRSCENDTTAKNAGAYINGTKDVPVINLNSPRVVGDYTNYATDISVTAGNKPLAKRSAWGNQDSVYITVQTGKVSAKQFVGAGGKKTYEAYQTRNDEDALYKRGIAKVTGIYTGIQNVSLKAYKGVTLDSSMSESEVREYNPFHECFYTVYDPTSRFIIASVVVGSDSASSDHFVYAVSDAGNQWKEGSYDFWEFNAIVDGEEKVLTVKDEYGKVIQNKIKAAMQFDMEGAEGAKNRTGMFEVTLDKDGYVINAEQIWYTAGNYTKAHKDEDDKIFANYEIGNGIVRINNGQKLYETYFGAGDLYRAEKYTLYNTFNKTSGDYEDKQDVGVTIAAGAPIYVIQQMQLEASGQIVTDIQKFSDFNTALGAVAKSNGDAGGTPTAKEYSGFVSAVLSNGRAEWVVLKNVGTILNYNNSKGTTTTTPSTGSNDKSATLGAYTTNKGFMVTLSNFNDGESHTIRLTYITNAGNGTHTGLGATTVKTTSKSYKIMFTDNEATTDTDPTSLGVDQVVPSATLKAAAATATHVVTLWVDGEEAAYATFKANS